MKILDSSPENKGSYKAEVEVAGEPGQWHSNMLRFATRAEAETYSADLARRWRLVTQYRAAQSDEPVTHTFSEGVLARVETVTPC